MPTANDPLRDQASILGPTLRFKGELRADEDLLIKGQVDGSIENSKRLTICREGHVRADIQGQIIAVEGTVEGDVTGAISVAVLAGSHLTGDVRAPSVSIVEGAHFNGSVFMDSSKLSLSARPVPTREESALSAEPLRGVSGR
jgi:cytoskeletal protein CcmA (bactofilin family)